MNKDLLDQLIKAGFPSADKRCSYCKEYQYDGCSECEDRGIGLEELIEACGDRFVSLKRTTWKFIGSEREGYCWTATGLLKEPDTYYISTKETKREAVSHLWLKLNSK